MSSGTSTTARIAAICASERSVVRLSVSAPSATSARAVAGLETGSMTEILACMSAGRKPRRRASANTSQQPDVGDQHAADPGRGRAAGIGEPLHDLLLPARGRRDAIRPPGSRAMAEVSQAAFGRAKRLISTFASRAIAAISASSASVSMNTPEPCETRCTRTSSGSAVSSRASRQRGPSQLGISTR